MIPDSLLNAEPTPEAKIEQPIEEQDNQIPVPDEIEKVEDKKAEVEKAEVENVEVENVELEKVEEEKVEVEKIEENNIQPPALDGDEEKPLPDQPDDQTNNDSPDAPAAKLDTPDLAAGDRIKSHQNEM